MRALLPGVLLACASLGLAPAAVAEIYQWVDEAGRVHFTQDLGQVPRDQRRDAVEHAHREDRPEVQVYRAPSPPAAAARAPSGRPLSIPFEKRGNSMWVYVRLNDRVTAPFIVDTGASDVSIPAAVADQAGIAVGPETPYATYQTANGTVRHPIVQVDSVEVGGARVEGVRGSINASMTVGLLGGTFFNNFTFQIDPAAQVITLVPNARVRGGLSERQWRERFARAHGRLAVLERYMAENHFTRASRVRELEAKRAELEAAVDTLDAEADRAGVPEAWRDAH